MARIAQLELFFVYIHFLAVDSCDASLKSGNVSDTVSSQSLVNKQEILQLKQVLSSVLSTPVTYSLDFIKFLDSMAYVYNSA